jgi:hypothetical protein
LVAASLTFGSACGEDSSDGSGGSTAEGGVTGSSAGVGGTGAASGAGASAGTGASAGGGGAAGVDRGCPGDAPLAFATELDLSEATIAGLSAMDLADVNADDRLDVGVFEGGKHANGGITFAWLESPQNPGAEWIRHDLPQPSPFRPFIGAAKFGDVDGDADPDLVVSMDQHSGASPSAYLYWLENPGGSGNWSIHTIAGDRAVHHINDMELADLDGDGKLDVVVRALDPNQLMLYFQNGADDWQERIIDSTPFGATGEGFTVGDIDGKGELDFSICGHWLQAPGDPRTGSYAPHGIDTAYKSVNANVKEAIGDIDGDGRSDVILSPAEGFRDGGNHVLAWYQSPSDPANSDSWTQHVLASDFNGGHTVRLVDLDGDGDLDVVSGVAWSSWGQTANVTVYRNCAGALGEAQVLVTGKGLYSGVVGDIGGDGDVDIVGQNAYSAGSRPYLYESLE